MLVQVDIDPAAEETKGGAGHVAKALFSYGPDRVGVVCYVPKELQVCWGQLGLERGLGAGSFHELGIISDAGSIEIVHTLGYFPNIAYPGVPLGIQNRIRLVGLVVSLFI